MEGKIGNFLVDLKKLFLILSKKVYITSLIYFKCDKITLLRPLMTVEINSLSKAGTCLKLQLIWCRSTL